MQGRDLRHTIMAIEEDVGAERAAHIIKMLKTEGRAKLISTIKDPQSGMMNATDFEILGPIVFFLTSTALTIDEEVWNRDLVLSADESREQTRRILEMQRFLQTKEGWRMRADRERTRTLHRNAQRLLKPYRVVNPFAGELRFPDHRHRLRRDHDKYTGLIAAVTLLHQYQREIKREEVSPGVWEEYVEATREDIRLAGELAAIVLGRGLDDVPPQTRSFLRQASALVREKAVSLEVDVSVVRVTTRELREKTGLSIPTIHRHLWKLMELECVQSWPVLRTRRMEYEIIFDGEEELVMDGASPIPPH
jgi:DNA primase